MELLIRRANDGPEIINLITTHMAWRPYGNLIDGELDNSVPGKVTGWIRFFRQGKDPLTVTLDLAGDFHDDIRGKVIRLSNPMPSDREEDSGMKGEYFEDFAPVQRGIAGDITAGISLGPWTPEIAQRLMAQNEAFWDENGVHGAEREERRQQFAKRYREHIEAGDFFYCYTPYPYVEWYSETNGRVVLELEPFQVEVIGGAASVKGKTGAELASDERMRAQSMVNYMTEAATQFFKMRKHGGDSNVSGVVIR